MEIVFEITVSDKSYTVSQLTKNVRERGVALSKVLKDIQRDLARKAEDDSKVTATLLEEKARDAEKRLNKELVRLYGRAFVEARLRYLGQEDPRHPQTYVEDPGLWVIKQEEAQSQVMVVFGMSIGDKAYTIICNWKSLVGSWDGRW